MSSELDDVAKCLFNGVIPSIWRRLAPDTLKSLGNWMIHFQARFQQYDGWVSIFQLLWDSFPLRNSHDNTKHVLNSHLYQIIPVTNDLMCLLRALGRRSEPKSDSSDSVVFDILIIHMFRENASCCLVIGSEWYDLSSVVVVVFFVLGLLFVGLFLLLLFFVGRYSFVF